MLNDSLRPYLGALSGIEYSQQYGTTLNLGLESGLGEDASTLLWGRIGAKQRGLLGGVGFRLQDNLRLNLLGEYLQQRRTFTAADENYWVSQNKVGLGLQYLPQSGPAKLLGARFAYTHSPDQDLDDTLWVSNGATLYEKYSDQNRFVGVTTRDLQAEASFDIGDQGELSLFGGPAHISNNDGSNDSNRMNGGAIYNHYVGWAKIALGARAIADRNEAGLAIEGGLGAGDGNWRLGVTQVGSSASNHSDTIVGLALNFPIGGSGKPASYQRPTRAAIAALDLGLRDAARSFRSTVVAGQEKEIGRSSLLLINKAGLPSGASVANSGVITVPLGAAVLGIA